MFLGFAVGILGMFSAAISSPFGWASYALLQYELFIVDIFAKLSFSAVNISSFSEIFLVLSYLAIFFVVFHLRKKKNWRSKNLSNLTYILRSLIKWAQNENSLQIHRH